jgi:hypothetical protein
MASTPNKWPVEAAFFPLTGSACGAATLQFTSCWNHTRVSCRGVLRLRKRARGCWNSAASLPACGCYLPLVLRVLPPDNRSRLPDDRALASALERRERLAATRRVAEQSSSSSGRWRAGAGLAVKQDPSTSGRSMGGGGLFRGGKRTRRGRPRCGAGRQPVSWGPNAGTGVGNAA